MTNKQRARNGRRMLEIYARDFNGDRTNALIDLLTDLKHYCDTQGEYENFEHAIKYASMHHSAEVAGIQ